MPPVYSRTMSHALTPQDVRNTLHREPVFANLTPEEFNEVMALVQIESVRNGTLLLTQQGFDGNLYVIRRGKAAARTAVPGGADPVTRFFRPGDVINMGPFLTGRQNEYTVEAVDDLEVWLIPGVDFHALRNDMEGLAGHLTYPDDVKAHLARVKLFQDQRPGEIVLWQSKKHWWVFFSSATLAWLLLIGLAVSTVASWRWALLGVFFTSWLGVLAWFGALLAGGLIALWCYIDWQNDYYIVTDQRVIHRERVLLLYDQQDECPIQKVQNVNIKRSSWAASIFDVGDLAIETQGQRANVQFLWVDKPDIAAREIMAQAQKSRVINQASERAKIRSTIRREMRIGGDRGKHPAEQKYEPKNVKAPPKKTLAQRMQMTLADARYTIVPPMRWDEGGDIYYHRHWLLLLETAGLPIFNLLLFVGALVALPFISPPLASTIFRSLFVIPVIALGLGLLGWAAWNYEDWRNDIYILKPDRVIDFNRSPFGIRGTQQLTASMASIQNVSYTTTGFLDNLFNMGDVSIKTGAQDGELTFDRVWNPRGVQRDIVDRLERFQSAQREMADEARRKDMAEWLGIYDELAQLHDRLKPEEQAKLNERKKLGNDGPRN